MINSWGNLCYFYVFLILLSCGFGAPLSKDALVISAGIIAGLKDASSLTSLMYMYITVVPGILGGDSITFFLGRIFGPKIQRIKMVRKILSPRHFATLQTMFRKYGIGLILMARFIPMIRGPIYLFCGMTRRVSVIVFEMVNGLATSIYAGIFMWIGFLCARNRHELAAFLYGYRLFIYLILAVLATGIITLTIKNRQKRRERSRI